MGRRELAVHARDRDRVPAVIRAVILFLVLFGTWLLLSGHYTPLLLGLGVASCAFVAYVAHRMDVADREAHPVHLGPQAVTYWAWLVLEIVKSNIAVARLILHPRMPISPRLISVKASQHSELGKVIYANSITLTPGTVSLSVQDDMIEVHALTEEAAADLAEGEMDRRVSLLDYRHEGGGR